MTTVTSKGRSLAISPTGSRSPRKSIFDSSLTPKISISKVVNIIKEGWLNKKSKQGNRWRKRWMILTPHSFYSFKDQQPSNLYATEIIHLTNIKSINIQSNDHEIIQMLIETDKFLYCFQCGSELLMRQWMYTIEAYKDSISIPVKVHCQRCVDYCDYFKLSIPYNLNYEYSLHSILQNIITHMQTKHEFIRFETIQILEASFIGKNIFYAKYDWDNCDIKVADYNKAHLIHKGVHLLIDIAIYEHHISPSHNLCIHLSKNQNKKCPIFEAMKHSHDGCTQLALEHVNSFNHHPIQCLDKNECNAQRRLVEGGFDIFDLCHIAMYKHSARKRRIQLSQNIDCFCLNDDEHSECVQVYEPTIDDMIKNEYNERDGYLFSLIDEVQSNGFAADLMLDRAVNNNNEILHYTAYPIIKQVDDKLQCLRHKQMGSPLNRSEMLAIVLYTQSFLCVKLCEAQRNGNYERFKWFDYCLFNAVHKLSKREHAKYKIYTGINDIFEPAKTECAWLKTYISTTVYRKIALSFIDKMGALFHFDAQFREESVCCDVSWISKYGKNECEVLIARSINVEHNCFQCEISSDQYQLNGVDIQTVKISPIGGVKGQNDEKIFNEYPLMSSIHKHSQNENNINEVMNIDILCLIDGISEDIICGFLRMLNKYIPVSVKKIIFHFFFNPNQESFYLFPKYVSSKNLNALLVSDPLRIVKYPNIAYHKNNKLLAIGTSLKDGGNCLFLYHLQREIELISSHGHSHEINAIAFCKDGRFLVTYSGNESCLRIWDIRNLKQQKCIKTCALKKLNRAYSIFDHLMHTKLVWNDDGLTVQREDGSSECFAEIKSSKTHKTVIFICCADQSKKVKVPSKVKCDLYLSEHGISEAFNLSKWLNSHSRKMQRKKLTEFKQKSIEKPVQDALYFLKMSILENSDYQKKLSSDLLSEFDKLCLILEDANERIHRFKHEIESSVFGTNITKHVHYSPNCIVSDDYKYSMEGEDYTLNPLETRLKTTWILDQLLNVSSDNESMIVCPNEHRDICTIMIALWDRFRYNENDKIHLMNDGNNEILRIDDAKINKEQLDIIKMIKFYRERLVLMEKENKEMNDECFCDWMFDKEQKCDTIVICADSEWLNVFLSRHLSSQNDVVFKGKEIPSCSVIGFRILCDLIPDRTRTYQIIQNSITNAYKGLR